MLVCHENLVDGDVDELDEEADEAHNEESGHCRPGDLDKLLPIGFGTFLHEVHRIPDLRIVIRANEHTYKVLQRLDHDRIHVRHGGGPLESLWNWISFLVLAAAACRAILLKPSCASFIGGFFTKLIFFSAKLVDRRPHQGRGRGALSDTPRLLRRACCVRGSSRLTEILLVRVIILSRDVKI